MSRGARTVSTAAALVVVAALATGLMSTPRREPPRPPVTAVPVPRVAPPDARGILAHAAALGLTAAQRRQLEALDGGWRLRQRELLDRVEDAQSQIASVTGSGRPVALRDLQQRAAGYSSLSTELREARLGHAEDALGVLTATQALRLQTMKTTSSRSGGSK